MGKATTPWIKIQTDNPYFCFNNGCFGTYLVHYNNKREFKPDIVIGPSINDCHQDQRVVSVEMIRTSKTTSSILSYEFPWNHIKYNSQYFIKWEKRHIEKQI